MVVFVLQSVAIKCKCLHAVVVPRADGFNVGAGSQLLQGCGIVVHVKHLLHAVVMFADVVLVFKHAKGSMDLVFVHFCSIINYKLVESLFNIK